MSLFYVVQPVDMFSHTYQVGSVVQKSGGSSILVKRAMGLQVFSPMFPYGSFPILAAAVTLFFSYAGFFSIADIAGEIKEPAKTIPRASLISFFTVLILYVSMVLALVGVVPHTELATDTPVLMVCDLIMPFWVTKLIGIGILFAGYTTQVSAQQAISRLLFGLSEEKALPAIFSRLNNAGVPWAGVLVAVVLPSALYLLGGSLVILANTIVILFLAVYFMVSISSLKIKELFFEEYKAAGFKLEGKSYYFWPVGLLCVCVLYVATMFKSDLTALIYGTIAMVIIWLLSLIAFKRMEKTKNDIEMIK